MKWWIVGKRGLLGRAFCNYCAEKKIDFIATSSEDLNVVDEAAVKSFGGSFTHLINCTAYTAVDQAESDMEAAFALNESAVGYLAQRAKAQKARMIHFSTDYVFDGLSDRPYTECDKPAPETIYGKSKLAGEQKLLTLLPESLIVRTSWLFGTGPRHFVKTMMGLLSEPRELRVVNDQWGQPTFADDLVKVVDAIKEEEGIFHISGKGITTWFDFAQAIAEELGEKARARLIPVTTLEYPRPAKRPPYSPFDLSKIEKTVGQTMPSWKRGLKDYIDGACK